MTLGLASFLSLLVPALVGIYFFRKTDKLTQYFIYFITSLAIFECFANYLFYSHIDNLFVCTISLLLETLGILAIQAQYLEGNKLKKIILLISIVYPIYYFFRFFKLGFTEEFDTEMRMITCIILIITSGTGTVQQSSNMQVNILYNPLFLLSFSLLLYYGASLFVNAASQIVSQKNSNLVAIPLWHVHSVINIITNILLAISIWLNYRQKKLSVL
jgi:hypothetical protein